jgi:DNA anti-recombination protein RmuC
MLSQKLKKCLFSALQLIDIIEVQKHKKENLRRQHLKRLTQIEKNYKRELELTVEQRTSELAEALSKLTETLGWQRLSLWPGR